LRIGVLALQGNYDMHCKVLESIGVESQYVRYPRDLEQIDGLILPGGESTAMAKLMNRIGLFSEIKSLAESYPVLGTCAGLILMSKNIIDSDIIPLGILSINTMRNGYGRQINSDSVMIKFNLDNTDHNIPASFIRAPKIIDHDKNVEIVAKYSDNPVIVKSGKHMAISFHPELDNISILHEYVFKSSINK